jgi:hypothetical protein
VNPARLEWYWHRLRAMSPGEMFRHARRRWRVLVDERRRWDWASISIGRGGTFPWCQTRDRRRRGCGRSWRRTRRRSGTGVGGRLGIWTCGWISRRGGTVIIWQGKDLATDLPASRLEYRHLTGGADIKLIWELSRWTQLTRLAMAAHVLEDRGAAECCEQWLWDWLEHNPPYRGWNWTSALEGGMRLVQLTWMDGLLAGRFEVGVGEEAWGALLARLLPMHVRFVWRQRSFGSSANNHLLGELAGLIVATVRWPRLAQWGAPLGTLKKLTRA